MKTPPPMKIQYMQTMTASCTDIRKPHSCLRCTWKQHAFKSSFLT